MANCARLMGVSIAILGLAACGQSGSGDGEPVAARRAAPEAAQQACINSVKDRVGVSGVDVQVIDSEYGENESMVSLHDSNMDVDWQCMATNDGVAKSLTPEGGG